jgi:mono/diheme cytochrome c family protein
MKFHSLACSLFVGVSIFSTPLVLRAQDAALQAQITAGQQVYNTVCFACHQPTGQGLPGMFPPVASSDWVNKPKPDRLIRMVLHGFMGPITINGKPFTSPAPLMPPQGAALSDDQIANVLTYVRNSFGNKASAVTPSEVKAIRESEKARTAMWTEAEILKITAE